MEFKDVLKLKWGPIPEEAWDSLPKCETSLGMFTVATENISKMIKTLIQEISFTVQVPFLELEQLVKKENSPFPTKIPALFLHDQDEDFLTFKNSFKIPIITSELKVSTCKELFDRLSTEEKHMFLSQISASKEQASNLPFPFEN